MDRSKFVNLQKWIETVVQFKTVMLLVHAGNVVSYCCTKGTHGNCGIIGTKSSCDIIGTNRNCHKVGTSRYCSTIVTDRNCGALHTDRNCGKGISSLVLLAYTFFSL